MPICPGIEACRPSHQICAPKTTTRMVTKSVIRRAFAYRRRQSNVRVGEVTIVGLPTTSLLDAASSAERRAASSSPDAPSSSRWVEVRAMSVVNVPPDSIARGIRQTGGSLPLRWERA